MWNMTTCKCKLKMSMLEQETYLSRSENHIFALKSSTNTKKSLGSAQQNRIGRASANKQLLNAFIIFVNVLVCLLPLG